MLMASLCFHRCRRIPSLLGMQRGPTTGAHNLFLLSPTDQARAPIRGARRCRYRFSDRQGEIATLPACSLKELKEAFEVFCRVGNECAEEDDYNAFADLFTEDCLYVEHFYGTMHGREEVRKWIVPLMREHPMNEMVRYTNDWVYYDESNGRVLFCPRTHMSDPGDGSEHSEVNWSLVEYAGNGLWCMEEDIYNPEEWGTLVKNWLAAKKAAEASS